MSAEGLDDGQEFWLQELHYLLACKVAPAVAAVRAGWPTAMAAEKALERLGLDDLANRVRRDRTWTWAREQHALPGEAWRLHDEERASA